MADASSSSAAPLSSSSSPLDAAVPLDAPRIALNLALHRASASGDLATCQTLLHSGADAWYEDAETYGWSALHYAAEGGHADVLRLLLRCGGVWNAVDAYGVTAAEVAYSMNWERCYRVLFDEGVRRSVLEGVLARRKRTPSPSEHEEEGEPTAQGTVSGNERNGLTLRAPTGNEVSTSNAAFLSTPLRFVPDPHGKTRCLDRDGGLVMAAWETDIMAQAASLLCTPLARGAFSVLNVGFGLGIVDALFQTYRPARHVIIEAHPDAVAYMKSCGWDRIPGVEIFHGRWEDWIRDDDSDEAVGKRAELGSFDAVYWDTYSQDYSELKTFFQSLPNLLTGPDARFSFFHGLAATNPFFYDVYTRLAELDLKDVGLETTWHTMVPACPEEEWQGVLRKYWSLDTYACPIAQFERL